MVEVLVEASYSVLLLTTVLRSHHLRAGIIDWLPHFPSGVVVLAT